MVKKVSITLLLFFVVSLLIAQDFEGEKHLLKEGNIPYLVTLPDSYQKGEHSYPLLVFLHGGDRSNTKHHPKKYAKKAGIKDFPFIVLAPHCSGGCSWSKVNFDKLLTEVTEAYPVDKNRIYLTGYSMGGYGSWSALSNYPKWFAAASPIAGGGSTNTICQAKDVAIRAYHGDKDSIIGYQNSVKLVETLKTCKASAELITHSGEDHWIWPQLFQDEKFYQWFLSKQKS